MTKPQNSQVIAGDRSMDAQHREDRSQTFFFPKNNPPISIKAESREEAERELENTNKKEHD